MDLDWHHQWANYLLRNRDIRNWKDYARESAEIEVGRAWSILEFYKDPSELMISDSAIEEKAEEEAGWFFMHGDLRVYGREIWDEAEGQAKVSRQERSTWKKVYIETYRDLIDERIDDLIPKEIRNKLNIFCRIVTGMRHAIDYAQAPSRRPFGIRLGDDDDDAPPKRSRRTQPEEPKIRPSRKEIVSIARREGQKKFEADWRGFLRDDGGLSYTSEDQHSMYHPAGWKLTDADDELFKNTQADAYREALGDELSDFAPPEAWAHASLICLVYDRMVEQGPKLKKGEKAGFQLYREREESWLREAREGWEKETIEGREEWAKELREKEARLREAEQKAKKRAKK